MRLKILLMVLVLEVLGSSGLFIFNKAFESGYETGVAAGYLGMDKPEGIKALEKKYGIEL